MASPAPTQGSLPTVPPRPRRVAFAGTPADAVPALRALVEADREVPVVVTGEPRRRSRRGLPTPSPVAAVAAELGLSVSHDPTDLGDCDADCAVVVAYGRLISGELLAVTPMLNLHFSLLPRWRGAAPVESALLAGDDRTGVSLMALEVTLDTGPVYWRHEVPIGATDTAASLRRRLAHEGAQRLAASLTDGLGTPQPQAGEPTFAGKLTPADRRIDWTQPAVHIDRQIRVGGAWTTLGSQRFVIREATLAPSPPGSVPGTLVDDAVVTGDGLIRLRTVQPAGRAALDVASWRRGARLAQETRFDTAAQE
ncbi:methionyl-tRNA formyltransferase [Candidatus Poriferisodalis sp.]|uniref:methionyl-tRNA formyltransferase n=1 Tax=Candidatus Poriferisodalis sp. TaxID=3101277 RepID=UPI003B028571